MGMASRSVWGLLWLTVLPVVGNGGIAGAEEARGDEGGGAGGEAGEGAGRAQEAAGAARVRRGRQEGRAGRARGG
uniref:Uncharacterized protein n=1 Tax=Arundo donax TaxID=35708 RepID=A0A0A9D1H0_ARUDO